MIIYTCPKCGADLLSLVLTSYPPLYKKECPNCGWSHTESDTITRIPYTVPKTQGDNSINTTSDSLLSLTTNKLKDSNTIKLSELNNAILNSSTHITISSN